MYIYIYIYIWYILKEPLKHRALSRQYKTASEWKPPHNDFVMSTRISSFCTRSAPRIRTELQIFCVTLIHIYDITYNIYEWEWLVHLYVTSCIWMGMTFFLHTQCTSDKDQGCSQCSETPALSRLFTKSFPLGVPPAFSSTLSLQHWLRQGVYVCMYIRIYVCRYVCMCLCLVANFFPHSIGCVKVCTYVRMYVYTYECMCVCMCLCLVIDTFLAASVASRCVCTYVCMYICTYVCSYVCVYALCPTLSSQHWLRQDAYICTCVRIYVRAYVYMYVSMPCH